MTSSSTPPTRGAALAPTPSPRKRAVRGALLGGATILALLLSACAGDPSAGAEGAADETPVAGGTLRIAVNSDFGCIDPRQAQGLPQRAFATHFLDTLLEQDFETGEILPALATEWKVSDDAKEFTFKLREGVTFSDGTKLTAANVKENLDDIIALGAKAPYGPTNLTGYTGTEVVDDYTAVVKFEKPNIPFLQGASTTPFGIQASATLAKSAEDRCVGQIIGSGPYVLSEYEPTVKTVLTKRDDYDWASPASAHQGPGYFDEIIAEIVLEPTVRTGGLQSGQYDAILGVTPQDAQALESSGFLTLSRENPGLVNSLLVNEKRPLTGDVNVRRAFQLAVDRAEISDVIIGFPDLVAKSVLSETTPGYADFSKELVYDPDEAKRLLDESGWVPGADGIREKDGQRLALEILGTDASGPLYELLQLQLKDVGIEAVLNLQPITNFFTARQGGEWDYSGSNLTRADADVLRNNFISNGGPNVVAKLNPSELDDLLLKQAGEVQADARNAVVKEAQRTIIEQGFATPLHPQVQVLGHSPKVHGLAFDGESKFRFYSAWKDAD